MSNQAQYATVTATAVGVLGAAYCAYRVYREMNKSRMPRPDEWRKVGTLKELYIYPIKSCAPVKPDHAECTVLGLRNGWLRDRVLMIVDEKNNCVTARNQPQMLLIHPTVRSSILTLTHPNMEPMHVNLAEVIVTQKPVTATVWGLDVPVRDCGAEVSDWITRICNLTSQRLRLVYYASHECRINKKMSSIKANYKFRKNDNGALPDETPYNLLNQASVNELNTRLKNTKVTTLNFRPNFVFSGNEAFEEDKWSFVKIGETVFEVLKPCARCTLTTIDPETGERNSKTEPLETLRSYRQTDDPHMRQASGNSPLMGLQMALRSGSGEVTLNDPIYVV
ncbi:hypothetical protein ACJJTC_000337 [Scirpophaga incertulas]